MTQDLSGKDPCFQGSILLTQQCSPRTEHTKRLLRHDVAANHGLPRLPGIKVREWRKVTKRLGSACLAWQAGRRSEQKDINPKLHGSCHPKGESCRSRND